MIEGDDLTSNIDFFSINEKKMMRRNIKESDEPNYTKAGIVTKGGAKISTQRKAKNDTSSYPDRRHFSDTLEEKIRQLEIGQLEIEDRLRSECRRTQLLEREVIKLEQSERLLIGENAELKQKCLYVKKSNVDDASLKEITVLKEKLKQKEVILFSLLTTVEHLFDSDKKDDVGKIIADKIKDQEQKIIDLRTEISECVNREKSFMVNNDSLFVKSESLQKEIGDLTLQLQTKSLEIVQLVNATNVANQEKDRCLKFFEDERKSHMDLRLSYNSTIQEKKTMERHYSEECRTMRTTVVRQQDMINDNKKTIHDIGEEKQILLVRFHSLNQAYEKLLVNSSDKTPFIENAGMINFMKIFTSISKELDTECPVCFESWDSKHKPCSLSCGHVICEVCGPKFVNKECPECRTKQISVSSPNFGFLKFYDFYSRLYNLLKPE